MTTQPTFIVDFDSTLVQCESLDELARISLSHHADRQKIMQELEYITRQGMSGELPFDLSLTMRLQLFAATKPDVRTLIPFLEQHLSPSAKANHPWFSSNNKSIYIISGGFEEYIIPIAKYFSIPADHVYANRFTYRNEAIIGFDKNRYTSRTGGKAAQIAALHLPRPIIVIGDGYTDYEIKSTGYADEFWAFTETATRPKVIAKADHIITSFADVRQLSSTSA